MKVLLPGNDERSPIYVALSRLELVPVCLGDPDEISKSDFFEDISAAFIPGEFVTRSEKCAEAAESLCKRLRALEIPVLFDPDSKELSNDHDREIICKIAAQSEIFIPGSEDAAALCGLNNPEEIADYFLKLGTKKVVISLDKKGAFYKSSKECGYAPTFRADKVVDTKGAGIAFAAGLISGVAEEIPLGEAVIRANACGCITIQKSGELDGLPTLAQLREYMLNHRFAVEGCKEF